MRGCSCCRRRRRAPARRRRSKRPARTRARTPRHTRRPPQPRARSPPRAPTPGRALRPQLRPRLTPLVRPAPRKVEARCLGWTATARRQERKHRPLRVRRRRAATGAAAALCARRSSPTWPTSPRAWRRVRVRRPQRGAWAASWHAPRRRPSAGAARSSRSCGSTTSRSLRRTRSRSASTCVRMTRAPTGPRWTRPSSTHCSAATSSPARRRSSGSPHCATPARWPPAGGPELRATRCPTLLQARAAPTQLPRASKPRELRLGRLPRTNGRPTHRQPRGCPPSPLRRRASCCLSFDE
mmetsp:Transcript_4652/g.11971  ORF Transcript_4652/g.11971 Transcript_4652/m.11971 type:complete len:297 (-) Transcript_4652:79-969(-)